MRPVFGAGQWQTGQPIANSTTHLVPDYRPSQPHGWPATDPRQRVGSTIGGHIVSKDFSHGGRSYQMSLLSLGRSNDSADPVYECVPTDPTIRFRRTLGETFGADYSFHYVGGFRGRNEFSVESYSVYAAEQTATSPLQYGADLYVVYHPDLRRGDPARHPRLRWIQVARSVGPAGALESFVDNRQRANPFYVTGGLTSIYGSRVLNFYYGAGASPLPGEDSVLSEQFMAEVFLVRDTGIKDAAGKGVITVFGGFRYGWQVCEVQP